jgi:ribonucleoside-diphosphate reductase alpha chain
MRYNPKMSFPPKFSMQVIKRDGHKEEVSFDKVLERVRKQSEGLSVNPTAVAQKVLGQIYDGVKTTELDELTSQLGASLSTVHPDYGVLAARIAISSHQKNTDSSFLNVMRSLANQTAPKTGEHVSYIDSKLMEFIEANHEEIQKHIDDERDFLLDYFGFKTLEKSYLLKDAKGKILERPQHLWMRVSLALWFEAPKALEYAWKTYDLMSQKYFTHATPTLFNAGTPRPQLSSCFLLGMSDDSIYGIYKTLTDCALISKYAGGIGIHAHNIRAKGAIIRGTNGTSNGLTPMLRVFNNTARYVDQCFTPDTLILTRSGNKRIVDIQPGDEVFTSGCTESVEEGVKHYVHPEDGPTYCKVSRRVEHNYSGKMYRIKTGLLYNVVNVSEKHPFLVKLQNSQEYDYKEANQIQEGDIIFYPGLTPASAVNAVVSIESYTVENEVLYDLEVEGTHDYLVANIGIAHNGGGRRNGSFAIYLEPWHADVEDFLKLKLNTGTEEERARDLFYALWIPDLFMKRVEADEDWTLFCPSEAPGLADVHGSMFEELYTKYEKEGRGRKTVKAQKLWFQIMDTQMETGTPYLCYKDAANAKSNQQNLGTIKSSNLCVAPETYILTDRGQKQIVELAGQKVNIWNGNKWSETTVMKTGENQKLLTVHLSNGAQITCTPYHKFIVREKYTDRCSLKDAKRVDAVNLKEGMKLAKCNLQLVQGNSDEDIPHPYTHGFFCGDGTYNKNPSGYVSKVLPLYGEKKELIPYLNIRSSTFNEDASGRINTMLPDEIPDKFFVPLNASVKCRLEWLAGLLDSDGTVCRNGSNEALQIGSINYEFLDRIRLMLQTLGVQSKVTQSQPERKVLLPDGKGGRKEYDCKPCWRLLISSSAVHILKLIGLNCHRLQITGDLPQRNAEQFVTVVSVDDNGRTDDTYCFNEPENHAGVFNGVLTGNCSEIIEYSDANESAVCNLASLGLPAFVDAQTKTFNFKKLREVVAQVIRNLNRVIDINYYPTKETELSNKRHRPIGLGIQGLADVFALLRLPWDSDKAADLNQRIMEHIYYAAIEESYTLAIQEEPYETFMGSPASIGKLQFDLWRVKPLTEQDGSLDWESLKRFVVRYGLRNSLLLAPMPTASTSQIMGYNECFEPFTSNIYTRRTLAGEYIVVNKYLLKDLVDRGLWNEDLKQMMIARNGSVQGIQEIPFELQELYRTSWELKQRTLIDLAAARGAFICQSQSLNLFVADPSYAKLTSMHFHAWRKGLKTGCYYLRTKAAVMAQKFTVDPKFLTASNTLHRSDSAPAALDKTTTKQKETKPKETKPKETKPKETKQELLDRLAREYEEELAAAKAAAESGEGCLMCSG